MSKAICPVDLATFDAKAQASITVRLGDTTLAAGRKVFSTGSYGYHVGDKITIMVGDVPCRAQVSVVVTLIGSGNK